MEMKKTATVMEPQGMRPATRRYAASPGDGEYQLTNGQTVWCRWLATGKTHCHIVIWDTNGIVETVENVCRLQAARQTELVFEQMEASMGDEDEFDVEPLPTFHFPVIYVDEDGTPVAEPKKPVDPEVETKERHQVAWWLTERLRNGPVPLNVLYSEAAPWGVEKHRVDKAADDMEVIHRDDGCWELPQDVLDLLEGPMDDPQEPRWRPK
jgi:hypothetical protein